MNTIAIVAAALTLSAGDIPPPDVAPPKAEAPRHTWTVGDTRIVNLVYCKAKADAQEIAQAYADGGPGPADAILATKKGGEVTAGVCAARPAKFIVAGLASEHRGKAGEMNVIEVRDAVGGEVFYAVNWALIVPAPRFKVERVL